MKLRTSVIAISMLIAVSWGGANDLLAKHFDAQRARASPVPDCSGVERWPTSMAFARLKNEGIVDNAKVDFALTKTTRLASEQIGRDLYRQVHRVVFTEKSGQTIEAITLNNASSDECSMSGVDVFVIAHHFAAQ